MNLWRMRAATQARAVAEALRALEQTLDAAAADLEGQGLDAEDVRRDRAKLDEAHAVAVKLFTLTSDDGNIAAFLLERMK